MVPGFLFEPTMFRLRPVDDVRHAWKWSSVRFMAAGAAAQGTLTLAPQRVLDYAPDWVLSALSVVSLLCILLGLVGRVTTTEPRDVHPSQSDNG